MDRRTPEDFEFGYKEPHRVAPGRCTLRQALQFITDHQTEPEKWTVAKISEEYKLKPELTGELCRIDQQCLDTYNRSFFVSENILKYFRSYSIYIPDIKQKESILTQTKRKMLPDSTDKPKGEE